jgi:hypothetical protein
MQRSIEIIRDRLKQWELLCSPKKIKQEGKRKFALKRELFFKTPRQETLHENGTRHQ